VSAKPQVQIPVLQKRSESWEQIAEQKDLENLKFDPKNLYNLGAQEDMVSEISAIKKKPSTCGQTSQQGREDPAFLYLQLTLTRHATTPRISVDTRNWTQTHGQRTT
jgi:hypothetical protein